MDVSNRKPRLPPAMYRGFYWFLLNTRRALTLLRWLSSGQFSRAGQALLPYYRRYVPLRVRQRVPGRLRRIVMGIIAEQFCEEKVEYLEWITRNDGLSDQDRLLIRSHIASFKSKPKLSVLMPVSNARVRYLRQAIESILNQLYQDWELCIVYDMSTKREMRAITEEYGKKDSRVRLRFLSINGGVCDCTNTALEMASGDWIVFMNPDDTLSEHALYLIADAANNELDAAIVYSDHDDIDAKGHRGNPYFKPDWDYDLLLGQNYVNPLCAYRADLAHRVGGIREEFEGAQDWDFTLRFLELAANSEVHHIPFIIYHRRVTGDTLSKRSLASAVDVAQRAVNGHFKRTGRPAAAFPQGHSNYLRVKWSLPAQPPLVSIIIPTKDQCQLLQTCIDGLVNRTHYEPLEIVVVDNGSSEPDALAFLAKLRLRENVKVVEDSRPFNFARLVNLGVANSSGEICVLLNNDVDVINPDWLDEMVSHALRPEVGAVGAKLYYPDNKLQHGGVILGIAGEAGGFVHEFVPRKSPGYFDRLNLTHSLSSVTGACLATRRTLYDSVGGFNEQDLAISLSDIDFCLKVRRAGYCVIWTPHAELYRYESLSRGGPQSTPEKVTRNKNESAYIRKQWGPLLDNDPYYNPNLSLRSASFEIAAMSRVRKPWYEFQFAPNQGFTQETAVALQIAAGRRMSLSIRRRLSQIDWYKREIAEYIAARAPSKSRAKVRKRIAIYTAISGGYDTIKLPEKMDPRFDCVLFTDVPAPDTGVWQVRPVTYFHTDKIRAARFVKTHPHMLLDGYDIAIWLDSNIMILGDIYPLVERFLTSAKAVAAVPHPLRKSVYEELEACTHQNRDDPTTMQEQLARYRAAGFDHDDLIESNFVMFNLHDDRLKPFLDTWWAEIERYSRRDQLSLNYALSRNGLECYRLAERPNSIRNHPAFAFVRHDAGDGPARKLIDALKVSLVDPYAGPSYAEVRKKRIAMHKQRPIDIVVCLHNALEDAKLCLDSIGRARNSDRQRLIIIDDGSDQPTAQYLKEFADNASWIELHRNEYTQGYPRAANQGLAASTGELVILLDSHTIVTDGWAEKLADAVFSTPGAGIIGPMSNAAGHQSIPEYRNTGNQMTINDLPPAVTVEDMNRYCEQWTTADVVPRVPLLHGFCLGITREVIARVGLFDEDEFPRGYGWESDYCFRAADAGFGLVIATHTYIFHHRSQSYAESDRVSLTKARSRALEWLHGGPRIQRAVKSMQENPILTGLRQRARQLASPQDTRSLASGKTPLCNT
jgi:GT2 family glycosyltransferase